MDRFSTCTFPDCQLPSVRGFGPCERCNHLLCAEHRRLPFHACDDAPLPEDKFDTAIQTEVQTLRAQINEEALCSRASTLNSGRKCSISHPPAWGRGSLMGCANYHARIHHDDGSTWLLRVPRMNGSLPQSLIDYLVKSEYATLVFLGGTKVPAPRVFDYGIAGEEGNEVGMSYILMEQMPGKPWNGQGPRGKRFADEQDKERVWSGLADILIELRRYPFSRAGSLLPGPGPEPLISAITSERFLVLSPSGPFDTAGQYLTAFAEQNMALIADGQLFTAFPVNAYLIFSFLKDRIPHLLATDNLPTESFYLKHVDDKGDHLLVDDDLNITGMIDWQMARIVPAIEAFGPSLVTADMSDIYNGVSSVTGYDRSLAHYLREKGACDLAGLMSRDERLRRFFFGLDVDFAWDEALGLVRGIWAAFGGKGDLDWGVWKVDLLRGCGHDGRLGRIIARWGLGP